LFNGVIRFITSDVLPAKAGPSEIPLRETCLFWKKRFRLFVTGGFLAVLRVSLVRPGWQCY